MDDRAEPIRHLKKVGIDGSTPKWDDEVPAAAVEAGRPNPSRGERLFTDEDIELVRAQKEFVPGSARAWPLR
jgi:hypothetical protein